MENDEEELNMYDSLYEQRKEERLMMLWLKDQQQWVMYRLGGWWKRNGSKKMQRL